MRILFVQNHPRDMRLGSPKSVLCLGEALARLGHSVDYLFAGDLSLLVPWQKLHFATFPLALSRHLRSLEQVQDYDVVDIASGDAWLFARRRRTRHPVLVSRVLGLEHLYWREYLAQARLREERLSLQHRLWFGQVRLAEVKSSLRKSDQVLCLCSADRNFIVEQGWKQPASVSVIPPGADDLVRGTASTGRRTGKKLLFVGSWHFRKGVTVLARAFAAVHEQHPDVTLTIAGSNAPVSAVLETFPVAARQAITIVPPLPAAELADLYATHDVFVLPSLYEGFGMVFLEAMAHGMAVVGTDTGGMPDIIEHGRDGYIVPRRDDLALRDTLVRLLDDGRLRAVVGERARATASRYTWERTARQTAAVYQELLERAQGNSRRMLAPLDAP